MMRHMQPAFDGRAGTLTLLGGGGSSEAVPLATAKDAATRIGDDVRVPRHLLVRLCSAALNAGVARAEAEECLARAERCNQVQLVATPSQPIALYTLGRFALVRHGEPLAFHGKSPHKPIELLQALVALGGRDVHTELLMAAVWPGDESVDLRNLFDNTLHRLRHVLECDDALLLRHAKLTLNAEHCWVDAWAFDRLAAQHVAEPAREMAWQSLHLYQGHFLERDATRPWMHSYRARLRSRFYRLVASEGARLEAGGRWPDAVTFYESGIEHDPVAECLYQRLMQCHQRQGAQAEVLRVYRRCREHLRAEFGIEPAAATEALRRAAYDSVARPSP